MKDPGVVDAGACSGKVRQEDARFSRGACNMRQCSRLYLENVVGHLLGRDAPLCWMNTSDGVPEQTEVVTILQSQLHSASGRNASGDLTVRRLPLTSED